MKVKEILDEKGVWHEIINLETPGKSSKQFADQIGDDESIVKTIILKINEDFMAFCVPREHLVDYKKLREHFGTKKIRMANADEVLKHSTSPPGGCCPLLVDCPIYFDPHVLNMEIVNLGSGDVMKGLKMKTKDLIDIVQPKILEIGVMK